MAALKPWKGEIDAKGKRTVGLTKVPLERYPCTNRECNLGNFVADALVHHFVSDLSGSSSELWTDPVIALVPAGAIRTTLEAGSKL